MARNTFHYLPPETLDTLKNIEMVARRLVEGTLAGLHRSPYNGFSSEFSEYRKYCPGDPVRFVDWPAYAKTDRYYLKQFHEETNTRAYVLLDVSASMNYGGDGRRKFNYCCYLAAAFMYLMQRQRDAVGLFTYSDRIHDYLPARGSPANLRHLLSHLETLRPAGATRAAPCLHRVAETIPRRSIVLIFSDFLDPEPDFMHGLDHFRYQQHEVLLFQILDPVETEFPFTGLAEFRDVETGEIIEVECEDYRDTYLAELNAYNSRFKDACDRMSIRLEHMTTASPFERALLAYFHKRQTLA